MPALREIAILFFKLGAIGFGGPAAHLATMETEVVQRRGWMSRDHFLDLMGATNLIPGPNSTEMALHIGYHRAGWAGLLVAGVCFIGPAFVCTTTLAAVYVAYGHLPEVAPLLFGIQAAVLAIIFVAGWRLARRALRAWPQSGVAIAVAALSMSGFSPVGTLLLGSIIGCFLLRLWRRKDRSKTTTPTSRTPAAVIGGLLTAEAKQAYAAGATIMACAGSSIVAAASPPVAISLIRLALFFLKVGAVLYGTGYVLVAYLEGELVAQYGWLSQQQLLQAIAIGQLTPGPILSSAAFIGYVVMSQMPGPASGLVGAAVATVAIFLPSFLFVVAVNPLIPRLRSSELTSDFLDAVNAASIGLMAAVTLKLCQATLPQWHAALIAVLALVAQLRWNVTPVWLVVGGGVVGWALLMAIGLN